MSREIRSRAALLVGLALAAGLWSACGAESGPTPGAVARYGAAAKELTCDDLGAVVEQAAIGGRNRETAPDPAELVEEFLILRSLAASAEESGLDEAPEFAARWEAARDRLLSEAAERHLGAHIRVGEEEVAEYLGRHPETGSRSEMLSANLLLLAAPRGAGEERLEELEAKLLRIRGEYLAGTPFGDLARRYSEAENAFRGGALPIVGRGELPAELESVAWDLEAGAVSLPIRLSSGVALIRVDRHLPPHRATLEEAETIARRRVRSEKLAAERAATLAEARRLWPAEVDWVAISNPEVPPDAAVGRFGDEQLTLESLQLAHRPPRLRREVERSLDRRRLRGLAEEVWLLPAEPAVAGRLRLLRIGLLARARIDHELRSVAASGDLGSPGAVRVRERRSFRVALARGQEGSMRQAFSTLEGVRQRWLEEGEPSADGVEIESWGPITRRQLADATTPRLAKVAFELPLGEPSPPIRLETTVAPRSLDLETVGAVSIQSVPVPAWAELYFTDDAGAGGGAPVAQRAQIVRQLRRRYAEGLAPVRIDAVAWNECLGRVAPPENRSD